MGSGHVRARGHRLPPTRDERHACPPRLADAAHRVCATAADVSGRVPAVVPGRGAGGSKGARRPAAVVWSPTHAHPRPPLVRAMPELKATATRPRIEFDRSEVLLPPVPLGHVARASFYVLNQGYDNLELQPGATRAFCFGVLFLGRRPRPVLYALAPAVLPQPALPPPSQTSPALGSYPTPSNHPTVAVFPYAALPYERPLHLAPLLTFAVAAAPRPASLRPPCRR
eukprot:scaffold19041_cov90-Isochrysis_galbana.AAC.3